MGIFPVIHVLVSVYLLLSLATVCCAYHHPRCTRKVSPQFQFPDCFLPPMDTSQLLSSASFVMSHDAATGYIKRGSLSASGLTWQYSKNQIGSVYQQLDDGARALDLRPKLLTNGTVIFQHGDINIPVTLEQVLEDAVRWSTDNHKDDDTGDDAGELVLLLPSNFAYQTSQTGYTDDDYYDQDDAPLIVSAMASIYEQYNIPYYHCNDVYGMTIAELLELAALPNGGYLLAMDGQDYYGTPCAKPNWVEDQLVACYSTYQTTTTLSCARRNPLKLADLQHYMLASANNDATNDASVLGPPANLCNYPLNEIQALWQVTTASAVTGMARLSSILDDNKKSHLNEELVSMIYEGQFDAVSVLAVDNVALHGNAIGSVLRTACGQSSSSSECGTALAPPPLVYFHVSRLAYHGLVVCYVVVILWVGITVAMAIRNRDKHPHPRLLWTTVQRLYEQFVLPPPATDNKQEELLP